MLLAFAVQRGVGQLFEQSVRFAIEYAVALLDNSMADGLRDVAFPAPRWTKKQGIFALSHPARGGQIEDQAAVHLGVKLEVEVIQLLVGVAELRLLVAPLQKSCAATGKFVRDQRGDQVDRGHVIGLCL